MLILNILTDTCVQPVFLNLVHIHLKLLNDKDSCFWLSYCHCSVAKSCLTLGNPMDCSTPGFPVLHYLPEFAQTHVHWVIHAIQPSCPLSSPSPPAFYLSKHQGLFQWVGSSHQVAKVLKLQLQWGCLILYICIFSFKKPLRSIHTKYCWNWDD